MRPLIRLTPPLLASRRIAGLGMPWMLSLNTLRCLLAPPLPKPLPPLPLPVMVDPMGWDMHMSSGSGHVSYLYVLALSFFFVKTFFPTKILCFKALLNSYFQNFSLSTMFCSFQVNSLVVHSFRPHEFWIKP